MDRELISLLFANAIRNSSYEDLNNYYFKKILFNQLARANQVNPSKVMKDIATFLDIEFTDILSSPSICGKIINNTKYPIIGQINDDPYECLSKTEVDILKYIVYGSNKQYSIVKNVSILFQAIKWQYLTSIKRLMVVLLKAILPSRIFLYLKKIYKKI